MKKNLLGAITLLIGVVSMNSQTIKDPAIYTPVDGYELRNLWFQSAITGNANTNISIESRNIAALDGELLFSRRDGSATTSWTSSIDVYDGATGVFKRNIQLASNVFTKDDGTPVTYPCNDIRIDAAGHVLVSNLTTDASATSNFQIWNINMSDGTGSKVVDCVLPSGNGVYRLEAFGVYGDVTGNGYLMSAVGANSTSLGTTNSDKVLRWNINGGVADANPTFITIQSYYPDGILVNNNEPRVCPVDNNKFYLDGGTSAPTLYDMGGTIVSSFNDAAAFAPTDNLKNGVEKFSINGKNFLTNYYSAYNKNLSLPLAFCLSEMSSSGLFLGMKNYFEFPLGGLGTVNTARRLMTPYVEVNKAGTVATIYLYAIVNGLAAYRFGLTKDLDLPSGIEQTNSSNLIITTTTNGIKLSQSANIEVFNFSGTKVISRENSDEVDLTPGLYIVKAITSEGLVYTAKVIVK